MSDPTVCAVMLTRDRPEMARRAVECFRAQTYPHKRLLIYDTGADNVCDLADAINVQLDDEDVDIIESQACNHHHQPKTIGYLRNRAVQYVEDSAEIIIHFDDDDWSHPNRIAEQVALLQSSGADCVGYREMLFWDERDGCAWLYADAYRPVGTSLCYWRRTWERHPFPDLPQPRRQPNPDVRGEDVEWLRGLSVMGVSAVGLPRFPIDEPRMIARIHSGNSSGSYAELGKSVWWRRVPEWDAYCRERMTL